MVTSENTRSPLKLCRFFHPNDGARLGILFEDQVYDLTASGLPFCQSLTELLRASVDVPVFSLIRAVDRSRLPSYAYTDLDRCPHPSQPHLLAPVDQQEVWAAGVTYQQSREARMREARNQTVYAQVYDAPRPELFFKSTPEKVVGPNDWIGIRGDSHWSVPEPELALVINPGMQIFGYTIGNDVSSRDIEGENPLYLPQAKIYRRACALGPVIVLANGGLNVYDLTIRLSIVRGESIYFQGEVSTRQMHRRLEELVEYLARYNDFPHGVVLLTGTGIVPDDDIALEEGDHVVIEIEGIGTLRNPVRRMRQ